MAQTKTNNKIITICGTKNDGKTTLGKYIVEIENKATIIIDIAEQFEANTSYRLIVKGINKLKYLFAKNGFSEYFFKGKIQIIYRFDTENTDKESDELFKFINSNLKNICIFCEELELYADMYLNKNRPLYRTMYLSRNRNYTIISVIKEVGSLSKLVKSATDLFILGNIIDLNAREYFNKRSAKRFEKEIKNNKFREFLYTDLSKMWGKIALKPSIIKLIK